MDKLQTAAFLEVCLSAVAREVISLIYKPILMKIYTIVVSGRG